MKKIIFALLLAATATTAHAQTKFNPFPPAAGTQATSKAKTTGLKQQCSGMTSKGQQCKRMVTITQDQHDHPTQQFCFQHKSK